MLDYLNYELTFLYNYIKAFGNWPLCWFSRHLSLVSHRLSRGFPSSFSGNLFRKFSAHRHSAQLNAVCHRWMYNKHLVYVLVIKTWIMERKVMVWQLMEIKWIFLFRWLITFNESFLKNLNAFLNTNKFNRVK